MNDRMTRTLEDLIGSPCFCPDGKPSPYCPVHSRGGLESRLRHHRDLTQRVYALEREVNELSGDCNEEEDMRHEAESETRDLRRVVRAYATFPCPSCGAPGVPMGQQAHTKECYIRRESL